MSTDILAADERCKRSLVEDFSEMRPWRDNSWPSLSVFIIFSVRRWVLLHLQRSTRVVWINSKHSIHDAILSFKKSSDNCGPICWSAWTPHCFLGESESERNQVISNYITYRVRIRTRKLIGVWYFKLDNYSSNFMMVWHMWTTAHWTVVSFMTLKNSL